MAQNELPDLVTLDPDGLTLAAELNEFWQTFISMNEGSARPSYAVPGLVWTEESGGDYKPFFYDGTNDLEVMTSESVILGLPDIIITGTSNGSTGRLVLDTVVRNLNSLGTLATNGLTLPAGTYWIQGEAGIRLSANLGSTNSASIMIRDLTNTVDLALVSGMRADDFGTSSGRGMGGVLVTIASATEYGLDFRSDSANFETQTPTASAHTDPGDDHILKVWRVA